MRTIWTFGDSFIATLKNEYRDPENKQWVLQLGEKLNANTECLGLPGSSLEYVYMRFNEVRHRIKDGDIVVVALTDFNRRWFFPTKPGKTCPYVANDDQLPTSDHKTAYKYYELYLNNQQLPKIYLETFLNDLEGITYRKNLHTVVLPCFYTCWDFLAERRFPLLNVADDYCLHEITDDEFMPEVNKKGRPDFFKYDPKLNHLCQSNHTVLADKIVDNVLNKTKITLKDGFVKNIIGKHNIADEEFSKKEFFNYHLITHLWVELVEIQKRM